MRVLIAGPDPETRRALCALLSAAADVTVAAECNDGLDITLAYAANDVDLIFMDSATAHLAEYYAAHAALIGERARIVGLVGDETAAAYALEQGATDFIFKPASAQAVSSILVKIRYLISRRNPPARAGGFLHAAELSQALRSVVERIFGQEQGYGLGKLGVKVGTHIRLLKLANVMYVRAAGDYVDIVLSTGERIHTKEQLANLIARLPSQQFVRTHRSFILNKEYVKEIRARNNDYELVMTDDAVLTSGSTYRQRVRQQFLLSAVQ